MRPCGSDGDSQAQRRPPTSQNWLGSGHSLPCRHGCPVQRPVIVSKHCPALQGVGALQVAEHAQPCTGSCVHFPVTTVPSEQVSSQLPPQPPAFAQGPGVGVGGSPQVALQAQLAPF